MLWNIKVALFYCTPWHTDINFMIFIFYSSQMKIHPQGNKDNPEEIELIDFQPA